MLASLSEFGDFDKAIFINTDMRFIPTDTFGLSTDEVLCYPVRSKVLEAVHDLLLMIFFSDEKKLPK